MEKDDTQGERNRGMTGGVGAAEETYHRDGQRQKKTEREREKNTVVCCLYAGFCFSLMAFLSPHVAACHVLHLLLVSLL